MHQRPHFPLGFSVWDQIWDPSKVFEYSSKYSSLNSGIRIDLLEYLEYSNVVKCLVIR